MSFDYKAELYASHNRNRVYDAVLHAVEEASNEKNITRKDIAKSIGKSPSQITMWLSGPRNWTLDTISHLLFAVGATMDYKVVFDKDRHKSNIHNYTTSYVDKDRGAYSATEAKRMAIIEADV